jgi:putative DNA primase/helicase
VPDIGNKISTPEEMSGLLNYALEGLKRLEQNNGFSYDRSLEEVKSIMMRSGSTLMAFIEDELEESISNHILKSDFYKAYVQYCQEKGTWTMSKNKVGRELSKNTTYIKDGEVKELKHSRVWEGVGFKDQEKWKFKGEDEQTAMLV